jgi:hypothetical protein
MTRQDDPQLDPAKWPPLLQFTWAFLGNGRRVLTVVFLIAVIVLAMLALKGAYSGAVNELTQDVPRWARTSMLAGGIGGSIVSNLGFRVYRKVRRAKLAEDRASIKPSITSLSGERHRDLDAPGQHSGDTMGYPDSHPDPGRARDG